MQSKQFILLTMQLILSTNIPQNGRGTGTHLHCSRAWFMPRLLVYKPRLYFRSIVARSTWNSKRFHFLTHPNSLWSYYYNDYYGTWVWPWCGVHEHKVNQIGRMSASYYGAVVHWFLSFNRSWIACFHTVNSSTLYYMYQVSWILKYVKHMKLKDEVNPRPDNNIST